LREAPAIYRVREFEQEGIDAQVVKLSLNPCSGKQTLCLMPTNLQEMPENWYEIENGQFWPINRQHSAVAVNYMLNDLACMQKKLVEFWNAFIVWSVEIKDISEHMNQVNHLKVFKSILERNILHVRKTWVEIAIVIAFQICWIFTLAPNQVLLMLLLGDESFHAISRRGEFAIEVDELNFKSRNGDNHDMSSSINFITESNMFIM
jgi:hypothetical protein